MPLSQPHRKLLAICLKESNSLDETDIQTFTEIIRSPYTSLNLYKYSEEGDSYKKENILDLLYQKNHFVLFEILLKNRLQETFALIRLAEHDCYDKWMPDDMGPHTPWQNGVKKYPLRKPFNAAAFLALVLMFSYELVNVKNGKNSEKTQRFFNIARRLPLELQHKIANTLAESSRDFVSFPPFGYIVEFFKDQPKSKGVWEEFCATGIALEYAAADMEFDFADLEFISKTAPEQFPDAAKKMIADYIKNSNNFAMKFLWFLGTIAIITAFFSILTLGLTYVMTEDMHSMLLAFYVTIFMATVLALINNVSEVKCTLHENSLKKIIAEINPESTTQKNCFSTSKILHYFKKNRVEPEEQEPLLNDPLRLAEEGQSISYGSINI
jgi:hypothetical protein